MLKVVVIITLLILAWYGNRQYQYKKFLQDVQTQIGLEEKVQTTRKFLQDVQTQIGLEEKVQTASTTTHNMPVPKARPQRTISVSKKAIPRFHCDGRQHCSQMRSYEEAKFFLNHCPNTKMDGDRDGVPCERQFNRYD